MLMRTRKFKGFAVVERRDGSLVWNTFRPSQKEAVETFLKHNPQIAGHEQAAHIVACEIFITEQLEPICFSQYTTEKKPSLDIG